MGVDSVSESDVVYCRRLGVVYCGRVGVFSCWMGDGLGRHDEHRFGGLVDRDRALTDILQNASPALA